MPVDPVEVAVPVLNVNPLLEVVRVDPMDDDEESSPLPVPEHPEAVDPWELVSKLCTISGLEIDLLERNTCQPGSSKYILIRSDL